MKKKALIYGQHGGNQVQTYSSAVKVDGSKTLVTITRNELPLCCPLPTQKLWNNHPRVFIALEDLEKGVASCPYCGTRYTLGD